MIGFQYMNRRAVGTCLNSKLNGYSSVYYVGMNEPMGTGQGRRKSKKTK